MKFPTDRPVKVVMLGAGGTGAYVAPHVYRLLHVLDRPARFIICDGDIVEAKNLIRQNFVPADLGENKARVMLPGCVDNNKTRQLCHQAFNQCENLIYIDSGNGEYTGQVVCGVRRNGRTVLKSIGGVHPEMLKATDKFPSEVSCAEAAQEDPQSIAANIAAATAVVIMVYNILAHGENLARQTDFSTKTVRMQTVVEKQRRKAA